MASTNQCTQYDNYGPRKIHLSGIKKDPYDITIHGITFADGRTYTGESGATQPAPLAPAVGIPNCRSCHGSC